MQRSGLIILGIILGLICAELLLRAGGFFLLLYRGQLKNNFSNTSQAYRILCLGDSFTQGIGAGKHEDYPYQLQELLNDLNLPKKFIVINKGQAGQNSSELLADLDYNLNIYNPNLVVLLTGMNDSQNTHLHYKAFGKTDFISVYKSWISSLRVYKLTHNLLMALKEAYKRHINASEYGKQKDNLETDEKIKRLLTTKDYAALAGFLIGNMDKSSKWKYINVAKLTESPKIIERVIKRGLEISPSDQWLCLMLAKLYWSQLRINEAEEQFAYIMCKHPESKFIRFEFAEFYISQGRFSEAKELLLKEIKLHGESQRAKQLLSACINKEIKQKEKANYADAVLSYYITDINVKAIKKKIRDRGINLIILSYPQGSKVSREVLEGVFYVDNFEIFGRMSEIEREKLLSVDNHHCNGSGYKLIAKNVLECILKNIL